MGFTAATFVATPICILIWGLLLLLGCPRLVSDKLLTAGQPIDGLNINANIVRSIQLPIRTPFSHEADSGG